jgi:hypothetical protein
MSVAASFPSVRKPKFNQPVGEGGKFLKVEAGRLLAGRTTNAGT